MTSRFLGRCTAQVMGDSSPDAELVKATEEGRLNTRADYEREVWRLLNKRDQYYVIDEAVQRIQHTASITNTNSSSRAGASASAST